MANLLQFRKTPACPSGFADAKPDSRSGYYEGYVEGFRAACDELGVVAHLLFAGSRIHGLLAGPNDEWDEIALVRYECFADLRKILSSEIYARRAKPHRFAAIAEWRFIATRGH